MCLPMLQTYFLLLLYCSHVVLSVAINVAARAQHSAQSRMPAPRRFGNGTLICCVRKVRPFLLFYRREYREP